MKSFQEVKLTLKSFAYLDWNASKQLKTASKQKRFSSVGSTTFRTQNKSDSKTYSGQKQFLLKFEFQP